MNADRAYTDALAKLDEMHAYIDYGDYSELHDLICAIPLPDGHTVIDGQQYVIGEVELEGCLEGGRISEHPHGFVLWDEPFRQREVTAIYGLVPVTQEDTDG